MTTAANNAPAPVPAIFWDIAEESLDEAAFYFGLRDTALASPDRTPTEVETAIEGRLLGAIDGIAIPDTGIVERLLAPALEADDPARIAVAAHASLAGGTPAGRQQFCAAFRAAVGASLEALRRGLELVPAGDSWLAVSETIESVADVVRAAFLDACAFRGLPIAVDNAELLSPTAPPGLQRAASRLLRHAPAAARAAWLGQALGLSDAQARAAAVETGMIGGDARACALGRELAAAEVAGSGNLLWQVAVLGAARDGALACATLGDARRRRDAIWALGFAGWRQGADACVDLLAQQIEPRLSAEAFCAITGLDLRAAGLAAPPPPALDELPAFEADDLDADLVPAAELLLPLPDVPGVIRWWNQHRPRFQPDVRYLGGHPITAERLVDALQQGPMRRRGPLAFELAVRTGGRVQVQTGAFLSEQRRQLLGVAPVGTGSELERGAACSR
jgi:uncharacterized protein (TIGR02270 family)